jgi:hypothetical protein
MLIEIYPNAVNVTDTEGKLPSHTACLRGATFAVIQLLFDRLVGDEQHQNGLSISDNRGQLPIHYYARSENARAEVLKHLLELYPGGIRVVDTFDMLPPHHASYPLILEIIRLLVEASSSLYCHSEMFRWKNTNSARVELSQQRRRGRNALA